MRFLVSKETPREMLNFCQRALESYVVLSERLYGSQFLSYNVHGLLHLVADVQQLGDLESFSAFCYENSMPEFRKQMRKPDGCLQQYYKRIRELNDFTFALPNNTHHIRPSNLHAEGPLPEDIPPDLCQQFHKLQVGELTFSTSLRDSYWILRDSRICKLKNIV